MKVSKDLPLAEITLRRYEKPYDLKGRELVKKICLSVGLLQPGDSRDIVVDVLSVLLDARKKKEELDSETIEKRVIEFRKDSNLELKGIASSNIRRQLKRLRDLFFVEKIRNNYRINEFEELYNIYNEKIEKFFLETIKERVREYFKALKEE